MEDLDIIEERKGYRVRLEIDQDSEKPYDDGAAPAFTTDFNSYGAARIFAFNDQAESVDTGAMVEVMQRHGIEVLERFLKIFRGATKVDYFWSNGISGHYLAFDTPEWREKVGADPENLKDEDLLSEIRAWSEGNVYGYIVEKEVFWTKTYHDENGESLRLVDDIDDSETGSDWLEVEDGSCWGLFGRQWAEQSAKEALTEALVYAGLEEPED